MAHTIDCKVCSIIVFAVSFTAIPISKIFWDFLLERVEIGYFNYLKSQKILLMGLVVKLTAKTTIEHALIDCVCSKTLNHGLNQEFIREG